MLTPRTRLLFRAWMDRSAGDPEKDEFLRELAHLPDEDLAELLRDSYTESYGDVEPMEPFFSEAQSSDLLARIRESIRAVAEEETPLPILRPRWTRYVAAASIGLVLISGAWWTWFRHTPQPVPVASEHITEGICVNHPYSWQPVSHCLRVSAQCKQGFSIGNPQCVVAAFREVSQLECALRHGPDLQ